MKKSKWVFHMSAVFGVTMIGVGLLGIQPTPTVAQGGPPPPPPPGTLGGALVGLTQAEMQRFGIGRNEFLQIEAPQTGLGPVFNARSCVECHGAGAAGGASPTNVGTSVVRRFGAINNGNYTDLVNLGGALVQARSLREILGGAYPVAPELVPGAAQFVSRRITTPVFGMGLIEAIPASQILARSGVPQGYGVMGVAHMVQNPITGQTEVGRFGWKSQVSTAQVFSADALQQEMGITNPFFVNEVLPQGQPIPAGADQVADPEDTTGAATQAIADFMTLSAPPPQLPLTFNAQVGAKLFQEIRCASCHVPEMTTGPHQVSALAFKTVQLYSDLLLHDMGPGLGDGVRQGQASGRQWRTAPLWGLRFRPVLMHDGRSRTVDDAIRQHGGEAARSRNMYLELTRDQRQALLEFLGKI